MDFHGKRIDKLKLALTTRCNLACPYCFVKKTGEDMSPRTARRAADLLLAGPGREKLLSLYGGEPLLRFPLIKSLHAYAARKAERAGKKLTVSVCSNLTLLGEEHLEFMRRAGLKVLFGFTGDRVSHDRERRDPRGRGTAAPVLANARRLLAALGPDNAGVSYCIFPRTASRLEAGFGEILKLGFNYVNLELIRDYKPWDAAAVKAFDRGYAALAAQVVGGIARGREAFLNPVNWELRNGLLTRESGVCCPFRRHLEVYPGGDLAFSPFLLNRPDREDYVIGNLHERKPRRYGACRFSAGSRACAACAGDYLGGYRSDPGADAVSRIYRARSLAAAALILRRAKTEPAYAEYVRRVRREVCF